MVRRILPLVILTDSGQRFPGVTVQEIVAA